MKAMHYPNIRAEMARRGLSSDDMAAALGMNVSTWRARMRVAYPFTLHELRIMCQMFDGCTIEYLVDDAAETKGA